MDRSESIKELAMALSKAQGAMCGAVKGSENPHFKSRYADLASVWDALREPLAKNNLSVVQLTEPSEKNEIVVVTLLLHSSGEWISGTLSLPVAKGDAQGYGSALTYARRYGLSAIAGIAPEDDDGNAAAKAAPKADTKAEQNGIAPAVLAALLSDIAAAPDTEALKMIFTEAAAAARKARDGGAITSITNAKNARKAQLEAGDDIPQ